MLATCIWLILGIFVHSYLSLPVAVSRVVVALVAAPIIITDVRMCICSVVCVLVSINYFCCLLLL